MAARQFVAFNAQEKKSVLGISLIVSFRMLGLFMLLPVLSLYAHEFPGAAEFLVGVAIGIYGLTQAVLQVPFGMASDHFGRKIVMTIGLLLFALGSVLAALADSIGALIFARAIQGAGAVSAVGMALLADLTREEVRVRSMATVGISIGFAFMVAIVLGPALAGLIGVDGIFWFTALLAIAAIVIIYGMVPNAKDHHFHADAELKTADLGKTLRNPELLRLDFGIFTLHMSLTAMFLVIPHFLHAFQPDHFWHGVIYFGVMLVAIVLMTPLVIMAEARGKMKPVFVLAIALLLAAELGLWWLGNGLWGVLLFLTVYFVGFNVLESVLPSLISKTAPTSSRGTAMGVYSSSQFLGAFTGGALGGWLIHTTEMQEAAFILSAVLIGVWLVWALSMKKPPTFSNMMLNVGTVSGDSGKTLRQRILAIAGVKEVTLNPEEGVAYLRVDSKTVNHEQLLAFSVSDTGATA
jgi:MFS family permease